MGYNVLLHSIITHSIPECTIVLPSATIQWFSLFLFLLRVRATHLPIQNKVGPPRDPGHWHQRNRSLSVHQKPNEDPVPLQLSPCLLSPNWCRCECVYQHQQQERKERVALHDAVEYSIPAQLSSGMIFANASMRWCAQCASLLPPLRPLCLRFPALDN